MFSWAEHWLDAAAQRAKLPASMENNFVSVEVVILSSQEMPIFSVFLRRNFTGNARFKFMIFFD
ncbi:hypothetical protein [Brevundimonas sp. FT23028]|uniref:hypothetical protein n=1 Tax=Brevundimonas sp. FT23028 TaxID=3393748 RepID=UPI003B585E01